MIVGNMMEQVILDSSMKEIDYVYYFAGIADIGEAKSNPYKTIEINIMGLTKALEAAVKNNVKKFIFASHFCIIFSFECLGWVEGLEPSISRATT